MRRIFISSTVYDLIDIRDELFQEFSLYGFKPVLSDQLLSGFEVKNDKNTIQSCIENVKTCEEYIIILSQRYGFIPSELGFNKSVTHLEYEEARKLRIPIHFFVRDRLDSDFRIWQKNKGEEVKYTWVGDGEKQIFDLINQHQELIDKSPTNNWIKIFSTSFDLKKIIQKDFGEISAKNKLEHDIKENITPFINMGFVQKTTKTIENLVFEIHFDNIGKGHAYDFKVMGLNRKFENFNQIGATKILAAGAKMSTIFEINLKREINPIRGIYKPTYFTIDGHKIEDEIHLIIDWVPPSPTRLSIWMEHKNKKYSLGSKSFIEYDEK